MTKAKRIDVTQAVCVRSDIVEGRSELAKYLGLFGGIVATGERPSHCKVAWLDGTTSWWNVSDLENVALANEAQGGKLDQMKFAAGNGYDVKRREDHGHTLYHTRMGAHGVHQLYEAEAVTLRDALVRELGGVSAGALRLMLAMATAALEDMLTVDGAESVPATTPRKKDGNIDVRKVAEGCRSVLNASNKADPFYKFVEDAATRCAVMAIAVRGVDKGARKDVAEWLDMMTEHAKRLTGANEKNQREESEDDIG